MQTMNGHFFKNRRTGHELRGRAIKFQWKSFGMPTFSATKKSAPWRRVATKEREFK
jgi:hypothetical protein